MPNASPSSRKPCRAYLCLATLIAACMWANAAHATTETHPLNTSDLASGPYASMHTELRKTLFNIDIFSMDLRFDEPTRARLERLAGLDSGADDLAKTACEAENAWARIRFDRNIPFGSFRSTVEKELTRARQANVITDEEYQSLVSTLPRWFSSVAKRGFRDGDMLIHRKRPDSLRTTLISAKGEVLVDTTDRNAGVRRGLLPGYLGTKGALRDGLLKSLGHRE